MKKWTGGVLILGLAFVLIVSYTLIGKSGPPKKKSTAYDFFNPHPPEEGEKKSDVNANSNSNPKSNANPSDDGSSSRTREEARQTPPILKPQFKDIAELNDLYSLSENLTREDGNNALLTWSQMRFLFPRSDALSEMAEGIKEAVSMVKDLLSMIDKDRDLKAAEASVDKTCPHFVGTLNASLLRDGGFLEIPCGLVEGSSVTLIGIPDSGQDCFEIELIGSGIKEAKAPPIVLDYKVLLPGQNLTKEPVTIQNTWTQEFGWGKGERCPHHGAPDHLRVDGLVKCNTQIAETTAGGNPNVTHSANQKLNNVSEGSNHGSSSFHFVDGNPFTATLWAGDEGFHMTVNGRHETSFVYRERLEPWLVNRVSVRGGLTLVSILAKGLPVSEDVDLFADAKKLKATSISSEKLVLLIGVFSSGNNFERRMALRRTWMQYEAVRSGEVAVRFFIGLHKNKDVNLKLWKEALAYGDIQLMPFIDYYGLLTYKTVAICILGTRIHSAQFIMKMDDDAFVRIDELVSSLKRKTSNGRLYGHISFESSPRRETDNKWFVSEEEWPRSSYPPWAHGPGYVISQDIARFIVQGHRRQELTLFKLEDVAVGIWIEEYVKRGKKIEYVNDDRFFIAGCEEDFVLVHYQNPRLMLCLWEKLQEHHKPDCCE